MTDRNEKTAVVSGAAPGKPALKKLPVAISGSRISGLWLPSLLRSGFDGRRIHSAAEKIPPPRVSLTGGEFNASARRSAEEGYCQTEGGEGRE